MKVLSVKIPKSMDRAPKKIAEREFTTISTLTKQEIEKFLKEEKDVDWREFKED